MKKNPTKTPAAGRCFVYFSVTSGPNLSDKALRTSFHKHFLWKTKTCNSLLSFSQTFNHKFCPKLWLGCKKHTIAGANTYLKIIMLFGRCHFLFWHICILFLIQNRAIGKVYAVLNMSTVDTMKNVNVVHIDFSVTLLSVSLSCPMLCFRIVSSYSAKRNIYFCFHPC
jgi:hypothetical protein